MDRSKVLIRALAPACLLAAVLSAGELTYNAPLAIDMINFAVLFITVAALDAAALSGWGYARFSRSWRLSW